MDHGGAHPYVNNPTGGGPGRRVGGGGGGESGLVSRLTLARIMRALMVFMLVMYIFLLLREIAAAGMASSSTGNGGGYPLGHAAAGDIFLGGRSGGDANAAGPISPARMAVLERKVDDLLRRVSEMQTARAASASPVAAAEPQNVVLRILVGGLPGAGDSA
jgi:hypothetical protein